MATYSLGRSVRHGVFQHAGHADDVGDSVASARASSAGYTKAREVPSE